MFQRIEERHKIAIDLSQWQGAIDFNKFASNNPAGVILRAYGAVHDTGGDTRMKEYATALRAKGIPVGSYFFAWIDDVDDLASARFQADLYIAKLYDVFGEGNVGDLLPILDLETNLGVTTRTPTSGIRHDHLNTGKMLRWANEFRNHFQSRTNVRLGLYTAHYWIEEHNNFLGVDNPLKDMPLWIAAFTKYGYSLSNGLRKVGGWDRWIGWQFSENGVGADWGVSSATIDLNYFEPIEEWKVENNRLNKNEGGNTMSTPRRTHGISKETMQNFLIDAGAVFLNYGLPNERILGATRGGNTFTVEQEIKTIEMDSAKGAVRGARRVTESTARISTNLLEVTTQNLMMALAGTDATNTNNLGATGTTHDQIRRTREIGDLDYITNVAIVGRISGTNENFVGIIFNALSDEGIEISTEDKEEAVLEVTFTAHYDPDNLTQEPWAIRNPKRGS